MLRFVTPLALLIAGCPTPPESSVGGGAPSGQAPGGGGGQGGVVAPTPAEVDTTAKSGAFVITALPDEMKNRPADGDQLTPEAAQAKVLAGDHITIKGQIVCSDCQGQLVVSVAPFVEPSDSEPAGPDEGIPVDEAMEFAPVVVRSVGSFEIAVPRHDGKVVLEVIDDVDGNGLPSPGERLAVVHRQGKLIANKNHVGLKVDFGQNLPTPMGAFAPPPAGEGAAPPPGGPPQ
jgi:hypothetical protein